MKVLLVGANGQVGEKIRELSRDLPLQALAHSDLDIEDFFTVKSIIEKQEPNVIINAAAYTQVDLAEDNKTEAYAANKEGVSHLATVCAALNIPLIHFSTDYVFDGEKEEPYSELDKPSPINVYGKSKLLGEEAIFSTLEKYVVVRTSWVFSSRRSNFVRKILEQAHHQEVIKVVNDIYGCPTPAKALSIFVLKLVQAIGSGEFSSWGVFHYCGWPATTWYDYAVEILRQAKTHHLVPMQARAAPVGYNSFATKAQRPRRAVLSCQKVLSQFKLEQPCWKLGLSEVLNELKSNP